MSAPMFLVDDLPGVGTFTLEGPEAHHAATVQRLRVGEALLLGDGRGGTAQAIVTRVGSGEGTGRARAGRASLTVEVSTLEYAPANDPRLVVAQGIPKGDRGELAVQAMTEVGVDAVVPWLASRSVAQWKAERADRSRQRWVDTVREATKQARRSWLPPLESTASTKDVALRAGAAAATLVLHEEADVRLATVELPVAGEILVVVGPEGGIAPDELDLFVAAGACPVRLGATVLRTSTAGVAALSVLLTRLGRW